MRHITEILRLKHQNNLSHRQIARSCGLPPSTVGDYIKRARSAGITWPIQDALDEAALVSLFLPGASTPQAAGMVVPAWPHIQQELRRKGVTLHLLWQEYCQNNPVGAYGYSRFCELYQRWAATLEPVLRQVHEPGEKMFVDWAGPTIPIHNPMDGSESKGHLFVAVLGASNLTYVEAFESSTNSSAPGLQLMFMPGPSLAGCPA